VNNGRQAIVTETGLAVVRRGSPFTHAQARTMAARNFPTKRGNSMNTPSGWGGPSSGNTWIRFRAVKLTGLNFKRR